jgi:hypothetical protein
LSRMPVARNRRVTMVSWIQIRSRMRRSGHHHPKETPPLFDAQSILPSGSQRRYQRSVFCHVFDVVVSFTRGSSSVILCPPAKSIGLGRCQRSAHSPRNVSQWLGCACHGRPPIPRDLLAVTSATCPILRENDRNRDRLMSSLVHTYGDALLDEGRLRACDAGCWHPCDAANDPAYPRICWRRVHQRRCAKCETEEAMTDAWGRLHVEVWKARSSSPCRSRTTP